MLLNDREHLPEFITNIKDIKDVLLAIEPEIFLLRENVSTLIKELYVKSTKNLIARWEKDFNLSYDASLSLQQRRQRILNKLARKKTLNWTNLRILIKNNLATNSQIYLINDSGNYHFRIVVQDPDYLQMEKAVKLAKPAYITFDIIVTQFFRYCNTFNCGTEPL